MRKLTTRRMTTCAIVAAAYTVITLLTAPLSFGLVQFRLSEALVVLCALDPFLGVGITLGCFLANVFSTVTALDMIVGTAATALACFLTAKCKKDWLIPLPNILCNALIVGAMLAVVLFPDNMGVGFLLAFAQVGFGELVVMYALGMPLLLFAKKTNFLAKAQHAA